MSVRTLLPDLVCPVLLPALRLDSDARHRGRAAVHCRMAGLGDDTRTRLKAGFSVFNFNKPHFVRW
ncbi:hypothetical protein [Bacteroides finegoldii]|uniref:hypothetical protein n=1 Tax=Bacteroides finegoldii TaxID=338188 RepID=UPI001E558FC2|nr:hypothetical protein [Bacteroides finegoldii]